MTNNALPLPGRDWICRRELAKLLDVSERTAFLWASAGRLQRFQHGFPCCGRKKYSCKQRFKNVARIG